jgi:hypothetical protein
MDIDAIQGMDALMRMAQITTIKDVAELLLVLRTEANKENWQKIDDMIQRLSTMAMSL